MNAFIGSSQGSGKSYDSRPMTKLDPPAPAWLVPDPCLLAAVPPTAGEENKTVDSDLE